MPGDLTSVLAALICAAFVTAAEPVLIPLLRRAVVDVPNERSWHSVTWGIPPEAALAPFGLYLADTAWTLQRRIRAVERIFEAHRTHTYQQLCDVGWSHQRVTLATTAVTAALCLLGAASLIGHPGLRAAADLAVGLLTAYLRSPMLLGRARVLVEAS